MYLMNYKPECMTYELLTKHEVKMDGYLHHSLCVFIDRDESMSMDM